MVRYRKPVELSDNIIDRRRPGTARFAAKRQADAAKKQAEEVLADALIQAMRLRNRRPR